MTPQARENVTEFDEEQTALLEQLAQNGDLNADIYGHADMDFQANALSTDVQDSEDPALEAALLEGFANFEQTPEVNFEYTPEDQLRNSTSDDPLAGLLEAVTVASKEPAIREQLLSMPDDGFFRRSFIPEDRSKRQRDADTIVPCIETPELSGSKRQKKTPRRKSPEEVASQRELWGSDDEGDETLDNSPLAEPDTSNHPTVRAGAAFPSSAALYRPPTKAPRKYSRPAMSKLFASLELEPEPFLYLQAAAKTYMLDPDHPDRRNCVGIKGRGESDITKLKLYATVKDFLKDEGWGDKCFGSAASDFSTRKLRWPEHDHKLIALVTPLMRRMVTNERQRQYAIDKRQGIIGTKEHASSTPPTESIPAPRPGEVDSAFSFDLELDQCSLSLDSLISTADGYGTPTPQNGNTPGQQDGSDDFEIRYHVNIMKDGRRMKPKVMLTPVVCPDFTNLTKHINSLIDDVGQKLKSIQVLGPGSLLEAKDEHTWRQAIESIRESEWMDGDVKCVVEVEAIS